MTELSENKHGIEEVDGVINHLVAEILGGSVSVDSLNGECRLQEINLNSMSVIKLLVLLEEMYDVEFDVSKLVDARIELLGDLYSVVKAELNKNSGGK